MPTKFTPATTEKILTAVRAGNYYTTAAAAAGVNKTTLYAWIAKGEASETAEHREFYERICEADALAEIDAVAKVREGKQGWQAHMTFLERRHSERWSGGGAPGQPPRDTQETTDEFFTRLAEERHAAAKPRPADESPPLHAVTGD